jgi:hypothetical protein
VFVSYFLLVLNFRFGRLAFRVGPSELNPLVLAINVSCTSVLVLISWVWTGDLPLNKL